MLEAPMQNPFGISIRDLPITVTVRGGAVVPGQVVAFDLIRTYATGILPAANGPLSIVRPVYAGAIKYGILGVCLSAAADGKRVKVIVEGEVEALCQADLGTLAYGKELFADNASTRLRDSGAAGVKCVGTSLEQKATPSAKLTRILFSGMYGLGVAT